MINPYILLALFVSFVLTNGYAYHTVGNQVVKNIHIKVLDKANENIEKNPKPVQQHEECRDGKKALIEFIRNEHK